jgi:phage terminase large subunit GpA-like protein
MALKTDATIRSVSRSHKAKTTAQKTYDTLEDIWIDLADLLRPPERLTVAEASEKYVRLNNPGSYIGPYRNRTAPYMEEPMNELQSRSLTGEVFVGPAQCAKTQALILNWIAYSAKVDGMDMIVYSPTQSAARDFSVRRVDRMHRYSPEIGSAMLTDRESDNVHDKHYRNGMLLNLSWPTVTEFAGRPVGRIALTDYDRMDDDIGGDGTPYDLGSKRTTSFRSFAMTLAESSPSRPIEDPKWISSSPHEAPPCKGILSLYNRGDRRRWYWPCPDCGSYFEGKWEHLEWDDRKSPLLSAETVYMRCPVSGCRIEPTQRGYMQEWGLWLKDGQFLDRRGLVVGKGVRATIASFWLNGVAAAFTTWQNLVNAYLIAYREYEKTGSEDSLAKFFNTDLGQPYIPKREESELLPEVLKSRGEKHETFEMSLDERIDRLPMVQPTVPPGVRFLVATVDVQNNLFSVQVHGVCPGEPYDLVVVDRFWIRKSHREDAQGDTLWVKPQTYLEDWDTITEEVLTRTYPLSDGSGRRMMIKMTGCDSGGREGVTTQAYQYYRKLRATGLSGRFHLVKGDPYPGRPRAQITYPDASRKDKLSAARGDVPVLLLNSNVLKDAVRGRLEAQVPGKGMLRFPDWLPDKWFAELCVEVRTDKGWTNPLGRRNEAWDLSYYCVGLCVSQLLRVEGIEWHNPPGWAEVWDKNDMVTKVGAERVFATESKTEYDFASFGKLLAS